MDVSSFSELELALEVTALLSSCRCLQTRQQAELQNWGKCEELHLRRGLPLVAIVTMSVGKTLCNTNAKLLLH